MDQTRTSKEARINSDVPEIDAWDKKGYLPERLKVMMTFSDAQECTFQPRVCSRMPKPIKRHMKSVHNWAGPIFDRKASFENFYLNLDRISKRFPAYLNMEFIVGQHKWQKKGNY
jgi:hypothetical protein